MPSYISILLIAALTLSTIVLETRGPSCGFS